jgi:1-aminocyclopropane-1-carboxylate deaminase/D-cysteine desulfhydrase-like pyridoxal-dependent ACC family enzyme
MLERFARVRLGQFPTPLEPLTRLSAALGGPRLWIKRDDALGPGTGGNKTRKLEFLFGEAQAMGAQAVATYGGLQSNFARQMAAAARGLGLAAHCFYFEPRPARLTGNLFLAHLLGAQLHFLPLGGGEGARPLDQTTRLVRWVVRLNPACFGRRVYFMPVGGHSATGVLGYVGAAAELEAQLAERGIARATVVTAAGTGGTLAGLLAGFHLLGSRHQALGIDVGRLWTGFKATIAELASAACARVGQPSTFRPDEVPLIEGDYVGAGYARATPDGLAAIRLLAREAGLLLDPVYTAKAMAGLIDQARRGRWAPDEDVVFLHTGGGPALWADGVPEVQRAQG